MTGLSIALRYFQDQGFQVKAVIPEYRLKEKKSSNAKLLHELEDEGLLIPTPSKAYDDRILLESASRLNAAVVSNDYFRKFYPKYLINSIIYNLFYYQVTLSLTKISLMY